MKSTIELLAPLQANYERLKIQAYKLDLELAARYGDRYNNLKSKVSNTKTWYDKETAEARASGTIPLEERHAATRLRSANAGVGAARKEQAIKQKVRELWQSIRSR